jgi:hypothetical protein
MQCLISYSFRHPLNRMFYDYITLAYPSRPIQRQVATCYRAVGESGDAVGFILAVVTVDNHVVTSLSSCKKQD